jgi:thiamine biosynthesis protein ThiI
MKYLVRLGSDITVKSDRIRARFVGRLDANLRAGFKRAAVEATIQREWSRLFVESDDPRVGDVIRRTFGVSSFSPIDRELTADLEGLAAATAELYGDLVEGKSFAIRPRRIGTHACSSVDVGRRLGAALFARGRRVDLNSPEVEIHCEIREDVAFLYSKFVPGPCGLPLGVSGRVLCLMSGGFDSAVSAWMMMKRGLEVDYLFCNLAGAAYERSVLTLTKFLADEWAHGSSPAFHVIDFEPLAAAIRQRVRPSHAQVLLKRFFYRAGAAVAETTGREALVTGECIGQVSSQTLRNLCTIERVIDMPVLRPVIGFDKLDIIDVARKIGSFDISASIQEYCQLVPDKPVTACSPEAAEREELALAGDDILTAALAARRTQALANVDMQSLASDYLYVDTVPEAAQVIDVRPQEAYALWHPEGARSVELHDLIASTEVLAKDGVYVLVCPVGLQSAVGAEHLQKKGYRAYSLRGGLAKFSATTIPH